MSEVSKSIAIIGAGPVGLEAALAALEHGYDVQVYERGEIADAVRQWGQVRMFSPFALNASERGRARLQLEGVPLPEPAAILTGAEFRSRYLLPLAQSLRSHIRQNCAVLALGRAGRLKGDFVSDPARSDAPFRLLLRDEAGERTASAGIVLDCSGTFAQPNSLGEGGIPVPGESACAARIHYGIPSLTKDFIGQHLLVVGAGHSAATVVRALAQAGAQITWMIRRERETPLLEIPHDPLPERRQLSTAANRLAQEKQVALLAGATIAALVPTADGIEVKWTKINGETGKLLIDQIVAATGFRPDLGLTRELQVQTCWATEGTYPLAASLLGEAGADCLQAPAVGAEALLHPEPGYFTLGIKSYGRSSNFLLRTGYEQVEAVFGWLEKQNQPGHEMSAR